MNYSQLAQVIQDYSENTESLFVANIPRFVKETEDRVYNSVQLPVLRKNVMGNLTPSNTFLSLPDDWLATYSVAVVDNTGKYNYLLNKDVNFLREAYPNPSVTGLPRYYALFGNNVAQPNELSVIVTPKPDDNYAVELNYFYYPESIVQGQIDALGVITPGAGYTNGVYANVSLTSGTGTGTDATATITISGGVVSSVLIANQGVYYAAGEVLTASSSNIGGSGSGFSVPITKVLNPTGTSWLGDNYDPVLFYGAMREAVIFMKGEQDMVTYYEKMYQEALSQLNRLGTGLERGDSYRDGQAKIKVNP
jgi:hypothetical protein